MMTTPSSARQQALSLSGKLFFGSLCASTFGLGCWQTARYFEKLELIQQRDRQLAMEPTETESAQPEPWRRRLLRGTYRHDREILVGPRGPPPGALADAGPSSGRSGGGMSSGPQGYFVVTPLYRSDGSTVFVNRGWIPRHFVSNDKSPTSWDRPAGTVQVVGVPSPTEQPRFLTPQHDFNKKPLQLFWFDRRAMADIAGVQTKNVPVVMTQISDDDDDDDHYSSVHKYPARPPLSAVGEFQTTPAIHAGYAATWFGLAGAGAYMTRKLMTRGRT